MEAFKGADILFLPKNMPFTFSDEKFIEAANYLSPKNLFPVHYFEMDSRKLRDGIAGEINLYVNGALVRK